MYSRVYIKEGAERYNNSLICHKPFDKKVKRKEKKSMSTFDSTFKTLGRIYSETFIKYRLSSSNQQYSS